MPEVKLPDPSDFHTAEQVIAARPFVESEQVLKTMRDSGRLRYYRRGTGPKSMCVYKLADIDAFVETTVVEPDPEKAERYKKGTGAHRRAAASERAAAKRFCDHADIRDCDVTCEMDLNKDVCCGGNGVCPDDCPEPCCVEAREAGA